jgi:sortase (surface protein transpeptidase)
VKKNTSHHKNRLQRLNYYKPLFPRSKNKSKNWRVRNYELKITRNKKFCIKFRSFKTSPKNRSKKTKQHVFNFEHFGLKEIAVIFYVKGDTIHSKPKLVLNRISYVLITASLIGLVYFGIQVFGIGQPKPPIVMAEPTVITEQVDTTIKKEESKYLSKSIPVSVDIEAINVKASIIEVGLLDNGTIETPELFSGQVGWYKFGPTPGELGPAVLVGHVDTYKGPSVFWNLGNLKSGDEVNINREDASTVKYIVSRIVQYDQNNFGTEEVYGNINYSGLRIITCGGTYNHITGRYTHNTVIFAELLP